MSHIDQSQLQIFLKYIFEVPISQIAGKSDAEPCEEIADLLSLSEMDRKKEKRVKKEDLENGWGRDKIRGKRQRGKEGQHPEKNQRDETVHIDQEGSEGKREEREDGSGEAQRDDQEAYPGDDEKVGYKSNGGEAVEVEGHQRRGA
jgi:hypothetical protein